MSEAKYVDVSGIRTRYLEAGRGEPMLLIHGGHFGLVASADVWNPAIDKLAEHFHVYAIDRPGQGFTDNPKKDSDYVIGTSVRHAYEFLEEAGGTMRCLRRQVTSRIREKGSVIWRHITPLETPISQMSTSTR